GFGGGGGGGAGGGLGGGGGAGGFGGGGGGGGGGDHPRNWDWEQLEDESLDELILIIQQSVPSSETTPIDKWAEFGGDSSILKFHRNLVIRTTSKNHMQIGRLLGMLREARSILINVETRFLQMKTSWFEEIGVDLDLYFNTTGGGGVFDQAQARDPNAQLKDFFEDSGSGKLKDSLIYGAVDSPRDEDGDLIAPYNTINTGSSQAFPFDPTNPFPAQWEYFAGAPMTGQTPVRNTEGWGPIGVVQNSLNLVETIAAASSPTGLAGTVLGAAPALGLNIQYLDDIQVDLLVQATQADERAVELSAPRLTFLNGQAAWVSFGEQQSYVSGLTPITGEGAGAFEPVVSPLNTGIVLWLKGAASADRRYVTLNVHFQKSKELSISTAAFGGAAGGGGFGGGAGGFAGSIELPNIRLDELFVTTSVPDKGTALLGGQRYKSEYETEAGVPILSKIPYINRFFTNRITSTEEKSLLILLRPEIIIQDENEDILFPGLSDEVDLGAAYNP
ncbi:MAG: hypothetical protein VX527_05780, partial [Planctomycetota bacterium]|nr:hypothetical protein [Planctomycetota bacterium]